MCWKTLKVNVVAQERMRSYERQICSEPNLRPHQKYVLIRGAHELFENLEGCSLRRDELWRLSAVHHATLGPTPPH